MENKYYLKGSDSQLSHLQIQRRNFLKSISMLVGGLSISKLSVMAGPFNVSELNQAVPIPLISGGANA